MKLCFDECIPPKWFRRLASLLEDRKSRAIHSCHLLDKMKQGVKDDEMVNWLANQEPPFMMVSGDNGRKSKRGDPRMNLLCPQEGITSVFIAPKLCQEEGFEKVRMVMVCIPELLEAYDGQRGVRYRLEAVGNRYRLREWPLVTDLIFASGQPPS